MEKCPSMSWYSQLRDVRCKINGPSNHGPRVSDRSSDNERFDPNMRSFDREHHRASRYGPFLLLPNASTTQVSEGVGVRNTRSHNNNAIDTHIKFAWGVDVTEDTTPPKSQKTGTMWTLERASPLKCDCLTLVEQ